MKTFDCVSGQIVGGDYGQCWVTYDGRKQGQTMYPASRADAEMFCNEIIEKIKRDCGTVFEVIYPEELWRFHFDGV